MNPTDSFHPLHHINHLALLVSAVALWMIGAVWYSPVLFSKPWMALLGIVHKPGEPKKGLVLGMIASFVGDLVLSLILWHMIAWSGANDWQTGAFVGFICWLGFFVAPGLPQGIYERRPFKLIAINNGYWLVGLLVAGVLLATWR